MVMGGRVRGAGVVRIPRSHNPPDRCNPKPENHRALTTLNTTTTQPPTTLNTSTTAPYNHYTHYNPYNPTPCKPPKRVYITHPSPTALPPITPTTGREGCMVVGT